MVCTVQSQNPIDKNEENLPFKQAVYFLNDGVGVCLSYYSRIPLFMVIGEMFSYIITQAVIVSNVCCHCWYCVGLEKLKLTCGNPAYIICGL